VIIVMLVAVIMVVLVALITAVLLYPKPRDGRCAGSYVQSGGFCVPKSGGTVRDAIPKPTDGQCWLALAQKTGKRAGS